MKFLINEKKVEPKRPVLDKAASKIASACNRLQNGFANRMNKTVGKMNTKRLKTTVVLFAIVFGSVSLYFIVNAVIGSGTPRPRVEQINVPKHFNKTGDEEALGHEYVDDETFHNIVAFKRYMDSLKTFNRQRYDSIVIARPHLMDSVTALEQLYNLQKQNSEYEK